MDGIAINTNLLIPEAQLEWIIARSSGPGGQNVNKVNSKVTLRWQAEGNPLLDDRTQQRLRALVGSRWLQDGSILITSQTSRDQATNKRLCKERLRQWILQALQPVIPRRPTRPTHGSVRRRLQNKQRQADKKSNRSTPRWDG
jgi:ribosome-associated protein